MKSALPSPTDDEDSSHIAFDALAGENREQPHKERLMMVRLE